MAFSRRVFFPLLGGLIVGIALGCARGGLLLTFAGFWGGLMWVLMATGPLALWYAARRQRAVAESISIGLGVAGGLTPWAIHEWLVRESLNSNEVWFPVVLAFLLGVTISPALVGLGRSRFGAPAT
jgi:hypothetical protein